LLGEGEDGRRRQASGCELGNQDDRESAHEQLVRGTEGKDLIRSDLGGAPWSSAGVDSGGVFGRFWGAGGLAARCNA
jgi:hypothetical protein